MASDEELVKVGFLEAVEAEVAGCKDAPAEGHSRGEGLAVQASGAGHFMPADGQGDGKGTAVQALSAASKDVPGHDPPEGWSMLYNGGANNSDHVSQLRYTIEKEISSFFHDQGLSGPSDEALPAVKAAIVSFNGERGNGKNFIISKLQGEKYSAEPKGFKATDVEGAAAGSIALCQWEHGWLMNCSDEGGTSLPAEKHCIPTFALATSNVFVYVTRQGPGNLTAYQQVKGYALRAWSKVQHAVRPSLVVVQNHVAPKALMLPDESTRTFLEHSKDDGGALEELFTTVKFVQLPTGDDDIQLKSLGNKTMTQVLDERVHGLAEMLQDLIAEHHMKQKELDVVVTQGVWLKLVKDITHSMEIGKPVNVTGVITSIRIPDDQFFSDVWTAFEFLLRPGIIQFWDGEEMVEYVDGILDSVKLHAATLMAQEEGDSAVQVDVFHARYSKAWDTLLDHLDLNIPCCAVDPNETGRHSVCCQPKRGHDGHASLYRMDRERTWWSWAFWVSNRWKGNHVIDARLETKLSQLRQRDAQSQEPDVFALAHEVSNVLYGKNANFECTSVDHSDVLAWRSTRLPSSVKQHCRSTWCPMLNRCYSCAIPMAQPDWLRRTLWGKFHAGLSVCTDCDATTSQSTWGLLSLQDSTDARTICRGSEDADP